MLLISKEHQSMTKVTTQEVTVKVKNHPREMFYGGRQTTDHLQQMIRYIALKQPMPDYGKVEAFVQTLKVDDIVGVNHNQYKVESIDPRAFTGVQFGTKQLMTLSSEDITIGLGTGFCEILYRDGKPFGIETEKKVTVKVVDHTESE
jgi:hypothetical protein